MGCWSVEIMGGDTALDVRYMFEQKFGSKEDDENEVPFRLPTPEDSIEFLKDNLKQFGSYDHNVVCQATGFLLMERGAPCNQKLRNLVLTGCSGEDYTAWQDPKARRKVIREFKRTWMLYPFEGTTIDLPEQVGLLQTIANNLNKGK